jgi:Protein of unknown function (DUF3467)
VPSKWPDDDGEYKHANALAIGFNAYEFLFRFGVEDAAGGERWHTGIVASPAFARRFLNLLQETVDEYERANPEMPK